MSWSINYYNKSVEEAILALPPKLLARYLKLTDLMIEFGADLGMPHTKHLKEGLIELRLKSKEGIARVFYCTLVGKRIFILHCFIKKAQKIPTKELIIAKKRLCEVKHYDNT